MASAVRQKKAWEKANAMIAEQTAQKERDRLKKIADEQKKKDDEERERQRKEDERIEQRASRKGKEKRTRSEKTT